MTTDLPATLKLSAKLPKPGSPERGDSPLAETMLRSNDTQYVLLVVAPKESAVIRVSGARRVDLSVLAIEGMSAPEDRRDAEALFERAQRRRLNGATPPPEQPMMDWGDDILR